jgi:hypothetical protein
MRLYGVRRSLRSVARVVYGAAPRVIQTLYVTQHACDIFAAAEVYAPRRSLRVMPASAARSKRSP